MIEWSTTCAFTHETIDIGETIYVGTMRPPMEEVARWSFVVPPILVKVKEPEEFILLESYSRFMLKKDSVWRPALDADDRGMPICLKVSVMTDLAEKPLNEKGKQTVGSAARSQRTKLKSVLNMAQERVDRLPKNTPPHVRDALTSCYTVIKTAMGDAYNDKILVNFPETCNDLIHNPAAIDRFFDFYTRSYILHMGAASTNSRLAPISIL